MNMKLCNRGNGSYLHKIKKVFFHLLKDRLYGSSMWIIADAFMMASLGFLFWILIAKLYPSEQVGLSNTLISLVELVAALSLLGFDVALIRYLPEHTNKKGMLNLAFSLTSLLAVVISLVCIVGAKYVSIDLALLNQTFFAFIFVFFAVSEVLFKLMGAIFIALRYAHYVFLKDLVFSFIKIIFPFLLLSFGAFGIFSSWMIGIVVGVVLSFIILRHVPVFSVSISLLQTMIRFGVVNYICNFLILAPEILMPLIITAKLGASFTAYFYISWMAASILYIVPTAISKSLLAHNKLTHQQVKKALKFSAFLLLPLVGLVLIISKPFLSFFGEEYSDYAMLLRLLALASLPFAINMIYITIQNIKQNLKSVLITHLLLSSGTIVLSSLLLDRGLLMIGFCWVGMQLAVAAFALYSLRKVFYA